MRFLIPFEESVTCHGPSMELLESIGQTGAGTAGAGPEGVLCPRFADLPDGRPEEARAWTIHQSDTAPQAAGVINTDFERGFIKAEIVHFDDLMAAGSMAAAKAAGKVRMEGKDYVMHDGDVVEFRFGGTSKSKG